MNVRWTVILCFVFFLSPFAQLNSQTISDPNRLRSLNSDEEYDSFMVEAMDSVQVNLKNNNWSEAHRDMKIIMRLPFTKERVERLKSFIDDQSKALEDSNAIEAAYLLTFVGSYYARNDYYNEALEYFKDAADKLYDLNDTKYLHQVYYWLGQTYQFGLSNGAQALIYAEQSERVFNLRNDESKSFLGKIYYLRGLAYRSSDKNKAISSFRKSQDLAGDTYGGKERLIAMSLYDLGRREESLTSAKKASTIYTKATGEDAGPYNIYEAHILEKLGKYEQAFENLDKALIYSKKHLRPNSPEFLKVYYYKARILKNMGDYNEALENCQTVFKVFYPEYSPQSNTSIPDISNGTPDHWILNTILETGNIQVRKFQSSQKTEYLDSALEIYRAGIADIELRRNEMDNWDAKEQYNDFLYDAYEKALIASVELYQMDNSDKNKAQVLYFLEKSKATILQDILANKKDSSQIPQEILDQENEIQKSITEIETTILQKQSSSSDAEIKELKNRLFDGRQTLENFKKKHSRYYVNDTSRKDESSPAGIVKNLPDSTLILAYHISDDAIIEISFDNQELYVEMSPKSTEYKNVVLRMRQMLSDWNSTLSQRKTSEDSINLYANYLGSKLFKTHKYIGSKHNQYIIMPNGALNNIPFELLISPQSDKAIIHDFDVSYAYLFSSLPKKDSIEKEASSFAGFAPKYQKDTQEVEDQKIDDSQWIALRSGLIDIPEARKSVTNLAKRYNGSSWLNDKATKSKFQEVAQNYDILHLGMHSLLDENTSALSSLVFSGNTENKLFLNEVQSMNIPASLVVLSACNTGVGRDVVGEGSLSIARAFFYAGAKSTLMSLWQVPDAQTSRIMQLFYDNLELGLNKNKALSNAKRDYLESASVLESHPAFWSGFVLVGDSSPLVLSPAPSNMLLKYSVLLLVIGFVGWGLKRIFIK